MKQSTRKGERARKRERERERDLRIGAAFHAGYMGRESLHPFELPSRDVREEALSLSQSFPSVTYRRKTPKLKPASRIITTTYFRYLPRLSTFFLLLRSFHYEQASRELNTDFSARPRCTTVSVISEICVLSVSRCRDETRSPFKSILYITCSRLFMCKFLRTLGSYYSLSTVSVCFVYCTGFSLCTGYIDW